VIEQVACMHWLVKAQVGNALLLHPCHRCVSACSPSLPSESPMYMQQNTGAGGSATHTRSSRIYMYHTCERRTQQQRGGVEHYHWVSCFLLFVSVSFRKSKNTFISRTVLFILRILCAWHAACIVPHSVMRVTNLHAALFLRLETLQVSGVQ
jgi:hypothetical protein